MPLSGVKATSDYAPQTRYRERGAPFERQPKPDEEAAAAAAPNANATDDGDASFYARRFKTDLSQLRVFDGAEEPPAPADPEGDSALIDFFGHLSVLLVAVRSGDITRAQSAADALELDALVERNIGRRPAGMLEDLVAMLGAAQSRDENAAQLAARGLAGDFRSAFAPAPIAPADAYAGAEEDGGAAYDTLTHYLGGGVV